MPGSLEEDGPVKSVGVVSLSLGDVGLGGVGSFAICFPLDLSPAEDSGTGAEGSEAPAEGGDPRSPKSSSAGNKRVSIG